MNQSASTPPPSLSVGVEVVAVHGLGRIVRPPVPSGTPGVVVGQDDRGTVQVRFATGHTLTVDSADVRLTLRVDEP